MILEEGLESCSVALTAGSCLECLRTFGLSPEFAAVISVILAVLFRVLFDFFMYRRKREKHNDVDGP